MEFTWLRAPDFFPPPPTLAEMKSICLGTKTRTIGDALMLSTLPRKLKALYPGLKVHVFPRAFNPVVFQNNPWVDGISYFPKAVYGDDINCGSGHLIQLKERFFDLPVSEPPRPEIHLTDKERSWARAWLSAESGNAKPLCILHPWGHTWKNVASLELWSGLVERWSPRFRFCQVGLEGHAKIPGCELGFFTPGKFSWARKLFALLSEAKLFAGVNSGPMHITRAFDLPSLILTEEGDAQDIFARRKRGPYFLYSNHAQAFLYPENSHLNVPKLSAVERMETLDRFFRAFPSE